MKNLMVILRATSILRGQKEDKGMMCSITPVIKYILWNLLCSKQVSDHSYLYYNLTLNHFLCESTCMPHEET
jgi:hypothetical protein